MSVNDIQTGISKQNFTIFKFHHFFKVHVFSMHGILQPFSRVCGNPDRNPDFYPNFEFVFWLHHLFWSSLKLETKHEFEYCDFFFFFVVVVVLEIFGFSNFKCFTEKENFIYSFFFIIILKSCLIFQQSTYYKLCRAFYRDVLKSQFLCTL